MPLLVGIPLIFFGMICVLLRRRTFHARCPHCGADHPISHQILAELRGEKFDALDLTCPACHGKFHATKNPAGALGSAPHYLTEKR